MVDDFLQELMELCDKHDAYLEESCGVICAQSRIDNYDYAVFGHIDGSSVALDDEVKPRMNKLKGGSSD